MKYSDEVRNHEKARGTLNDTVRQFQQELEIAQIILNRGLTDTGEPLSTKEREELKFCINDINERIESLTNSEGIEPNVIRFLTIYERALITICDETSDNSRSEIVERLTDDVWWKQRRDQGSLEWRPGQVGWKDFPFA